MTVSDTELVVVVDEHKVILASQDYRGPSGTVAVDRCRRDLDVQVRSARTGEVVRTTTLAGADPHPFTPTVAVGTREILGKPVPYQDLEDWLACEVGLGACLRPLRTLEGHSHSVECVAYSPDGQTLASGSKDATVRLWRLSDGAMLRTLEGPEDDVIAVAFSPDGQTLAASSRDGTVHLWSVSDGALLYVLEVDAAPISISLSFAPDGQTLATGSTDNTVRFWRVSDGNLLATLEGHTEFVNSVAFSPDGQTLASASYDHTVRLWRVRDGALLNTLAGHDESVASVAFSPDGLILATGSWDDTVRLWEVSSGSLLYTYKEHTYAVRRVLFSPDGQTVASYEDPYVGGPVVHLWRLADGTVLHKLGFGDAVESAEDIAFSPDWQTLALASPEWAVQIWQIDGLPWE